MSKTRTFFYWFTTLWLSLGMVSTGLVQILGINVQEVYVDALGYPAYFLTIIGVWKILGVLAILAPRFPLIKEWAYAGFFFTASGAIASHIAVGAVWTESLPALLLLVLTILSWYLRPAHRRIPSITTMQHD